MLENFFFQLFYQLDILPPFCYISLDVQQCVPRSVNSLSFKQTVIDAMSIHTGWDATTHTYVYHIYIYGEVQR